MGNALADSERVDGSHAEYVRVAAGRFVGDRMQRHERDLESGERLTCR